MHAHDITVELDFDEVREWIAAGRGGCVDSQGKLFERCRNYLLLVANRELDPALRGKLGASDLVQETFVNAQRGFRQFRGESEEELICWLRRILHNHAGQAVRRYRRAAKRDVRGEYSLAGFDDGVAARQIASDIETPSRQFVKAEEADSLTAAMVRLPDHYREVIQLRHVERLSFEEIGGVMARSAEAARKLWVRAIEQLRAELDFEDDA